MTSRKKIRRARRHTLGMLAEAEQALANGEPSVALKLTLRALEAGSMNPRVHADAALLLFELGRLEDAVAAARRAQELAPGADFVRATWRELRLADQADSVSIDRSTAPVVPPPRSARASLFDLAASRVALQRAGCAVTAGWLTCDEQESLAQAPADGPAFTASRALASPVGGLHWAAWRGGTLPWFDAMLDDLYVCAVDLANAMQVDLGVGARFPPACQPALPHVDRAVRLQLNGGAVYPERRDPGDRSTFPLRAVVALGPAMVNLVTVDVRPGKRRERVRQVPAGSAAWFCTRGRPAVVGGALGLQPVAFELRGGGDAALVLTAWGDVVAK